MCSHSYRSLWESTILDHTVYRLQRQWIYSDTTIFPGRSCQEYSDLCKAASPHPKMYRGYAFCCCGGRFTSIRLSASRGAACGGSSSAGDLGWTFLARFTDSVVSALSASTSIGLLELPAHWGDWIDLLEITECSHYRVQTCLAFCSPCST